MPLNDKNRSMLMAWAADHPAPVRLELFITGNAHEDGPLSTFCRLLTDTVANVKVKTTTDRERPIPEIRVTDTMGFSAVPLDKLLPPFLDALAIAGGDGPEAADALASAAAAVDVPAKLKLYVATQCPHCPPGAR